MDIPLPVTGYTAVLHDFTPQRVFEKYQEMSMRNVKIDLKDAHVTIDRVAEELGPDRAMKIQAAEEDERKLLLEEARREIIMKHVKAEINLSDQHAAEREKVCGMIKEFRDGDKVLSIDIGDLPRRDYVVLQKAVAEIDAKEEEDEGKGNGQSDA